MGIPKRNVWIYPPLRARIQRMDDGGPVVAQQNTVPYQPTASTVGDDGTINITGSGQSPDYLAHQSGAQPTAATTPTTKSDFWSKPYTPNAGADTNTQTAAQIAPAVPAQIVGAPGVPAAAAATQNLGTFGGMMAAHRQNALAMAAAPGATTGAAPTTSSPPAFGSAADHDANIAAGNAWNTKYANVNPNRVGMDPVNLGGPGMADGGMIDDKHFQIRQPTPKQEIGDLAREYLAPWTSPARQKEIWQIVMAHLKNNLALRKQFRQEFGFLPADVQ
jgi:hypothetical protein